jgi:G:T/U-mismatch repair DNA glycosylase
MVSSHGAIYTQESPVDERKSITSASDAYARETNCGLQPQERLTYFQHTTTNEHNCPNCEKLLIENQTIRNEKDIKIKQLEDETRQYSDDLRIKISENASMQIQLDRLREQLQVKDEINSIISPSSSSGAYSQLESSAIVDLEFSLKYEDVHKYVSSILKLCGALGPLWFNCRLDKRTYKIIAAYPGSIVERTKSEDRQVI